MMHFVTKVAPINSIHSKCQKSSRTCLMALFHMNTIGQLIVEAKKFKDFADIYRPLKIFYP